MEIEAARAVEYSKNLDDCSRQRAALARLTKRTSLLLRNIAKAGESFLWTELATGREFARLAASSLNAHAVSRRTKAARVAYDTIFRLLSHNISMPDRELKRFKAGLTTFKRELENLGEKF